MKIATALDYNAHHRALEFCVDLYFAGAAPLRCLSSNYLVSLELTEEVAATSNTPVGTPSANEVSFELYNQGGLFNPLNKKGTYYNKIKVGSKVVVFCRLIDIEGTEEYEWDQLGVFYIADWQTDITGTSATVVAYDTMYNLLTDTLTKLPITPDQTYKSLWEDFFTANNLTVTVSDGLLEKLAYGYVTDTNSAFLQDLTLGSFAFCFCDHTGNPTVRTITAGTTVHELTDSDQIFSIKSDQSIISEYDGVNLIYNKTQLSDIQEILSVKEQQLQGGTNTFSNQNFSKTPVFAVIYTSVTSENQMQLTTFEANAHSATYTITGTDGQFDVSFYGNIVEKVEMSLEDLGENLLSVNSAYIQNEIRANSIKTSIRKYILLSVPYIELEIRGNPKYNIGDTVHIVSTYYDLDFTGILLRQKYTYDGGLSSTITVLNTDVVGG